MHALQRRSDALCETSDVLARELAHVSEAASELQGLIAALSQDVRRLDVTERVDRGVQASLEAGPSAGMPRRILLGAPFAFQTADRRVNWARLRSLDLSRITRDNDVRALMACVEDYAYGDLDRESSVSLSESALLRLCRAQQMAIQYLLHERQQAAGSAMKAALDRTASEAYLRRLQEADVPRSTATVALQSQEVEDALRYLSEADLASLTQELAAGNA